MKRILTTLVLAAVASGTALAQEEELKDAVKKAAQYDSYTFSMEMTVEGMPGKKGGGSQMIGGQYQQDVGLFAANETIEIVKAGGVILFDAGDGWKKVERRAKNEKKERKKKKKKDPGDEEQKDEGINQDPEPEQEPGQGGEPKDKEEKKREKKERKEGGPRPDRPPRIVGMLREPHIELNLIGRGIDQVEDVEDNDDGVVYTATLKEEAAAKLSILGGRLRRGDGTITARVK
ncbi:MAG: hypothetical protein ACYTAF_07870, partial [Planctomycetota bacterium]